MTNKGSIVRRKAAKAKAKAKARQNKKKEHSRDEDEYDEDEENNYSSDNRESDSEEAEELENPEAAEEEFKFKILPELLAKNPRAYEYFYDLRNYILKAEQEFFKNHPDGSKKSPTEALYETLEKISLEDIESLKEHLPSSDELKMLEKKIMQEPIFNENGVEGAKDEAEVSEDIGNSESELDYDEDKEGFDDDDGVAEDVEDRKGDEDDEDGEDEFDIDDLLAYHNVEIPKSADGSYFSTEMDNDEFVMLQATHMTEKEIMSTRFRMGEALSRNQFEKSFQILQQELDGHELRDILSEFYYELVKQYELGTNEKIDLTELLERCTFDQITDDYIRLHENHRKKEEAKQENVHDTDEHMEPIPQKENKNDDANANIEIGMYGWGSLLQAELHRRRIFREMLLWFKIKLAGSRIDGNYAALKM